MKSGELVALLQRVDPTGEREVCVGNEAVVDAVLDPAYYDGALHSFETDADGAITSARFVRRGEKVQVRTLSIREALLDCPDLPVEYDCGPLPPRLTACVEKWRAEGRALDERWQQAVDSGAVQVFKTSCRPKESE